MKREKITIVVPIRKGSQRVKNKNFKPFADSNLLKVKLDVLKQVDVIDEIVVNTDSDIALQIADEYGVSKCIREDYYASSECNNSEFFQNIAENTDTDYIIYSPCTAPLIKVDTYYDFINRFRNAKDRYDSLTTVTDVKQHLWLDEKPINYNPSDSPNTQNLPDIVSLTYGISIISKNNMIKYRNIVGEKPLFYKLDDFEAVDVDNPIDFEFAEFLYRKYRS
jgi:CMP-N-acetylneuraminic acid synthetase